MFARVSAMAEKISKKILKGDIQSAYDKGFKEDMTKEGVRINGWGYW